MTKQTRAKSARKKLNAPAFKNIAAMYRDTENNRVIFTTKNMLKNQFKRDAPKITASFDRLAKTDLEACSELFGEAMGLVIRHLPQVDDDSYKPTVARLLATAVNTYLASIEVARHGYRRQYGMLGRSFIEIIATVVAIATETDNLERFHAGKLSSSKCIGWATKIIPILGKYYGMLSEYNVHVGPIHAMFEPVKCYKEDEEARKVIVSSMKADVWLMYLTAELVFHDEVIGPRYWKSEGPGIRYDPSEVEQEWMLKFLAFDEQGNL